MNKVLGTCDCPLPWCREPGAEVREGEKGSPYVICDACNSMIRTQSRKGKAGMRALVAPATPAAPEVKGGVKESEPAPVPKAKRKGLGLGFV